LISVESSRYVEEGGAGTSSALTRFGDGNVNRADDEPVPFFD
jgi:hypothetical protein